MEKQIANWLEQIIREENHPSSIVAFNFGLIQSDLGFQIYLVGSETYDPDVGELRKLEIG